MTGTQLILTMSIICGGAVLQGVAGFGLGMLTVPLLLRFLPPTFVTPMELVVSTFMNAYVAWSLRRDINFKLIAAIFIGSAIGVMPGVWLLRTVPPEPFKLTAGVIIAACGVLLWLGLKSPLENRFWQTVVGFISGMMNGALSVCGPPVAIFMAAGDMPKNTFRASIGTFFFALNIITLAATGAQGVLTLEIARQSVMIVPAVLLGIAIGMKLASHVSERVFHSIVLEVIIASGLSLVF